MNVLLCHIHKSGGSRAEVNNQKCNFFSSVTYLCSLYFKKNLKKNKGQYKLKEGRIEEIIEAE
jgi:hypothetical protein